LKFQGKARPKKAPETAAFAALSGAGFCASGAAVFAALSGAKRAQR
jgi:hypothetical protein